ncbi:MAG TPA: helix-turn-helix transcriptional regulator [Bacteroidales bacterium]|nr:helix-turn-helix transcriptional regulator [Bacteroidales bacterium]
MITNLFYYIDVAMLVTGTIFVLLFFTQFNENKDTLRNYRISKRLVAVAFFFVAAGNLVELLGHSNDPVYVSEEDFIIIKIITLATAVSQAFIFTIVSVMLLDPKTIKFKQLRWQTAVVTAYIVITILGYLLLPKSSIELFILLLNVVYCGVLIYFTVYFVRRYRAFRRVMDNFYSDDVASRMRWIAVAFYGALGVGVFALITTLYSNIVLNIVFNLSLLCFYTFFGIKLLNYPWQFEMIEKTMVDTPVEKKPEEEQSFAEVTTENIVYEKTPCLDSNICLGQWINEKHFLKSGITIDDLVDFLGINRTYISSYFNAEKGITFRQWINSLRIEEAKHLITDNPKITMTELASRLGYADTSTFFRHFKAIEGVQPSVWKQENLS